MAFLPRDRAFRGLPALVVSSAHIGAMESHGLRVQLLSPNEAEPLAACWRLRYEYFVRRRQWVTPNAEGADLECDRYDVDAWHFAVFRETEAVAYLRLIDRQAACGFMLEHEFKHLVSDENLSLLQKPGSVEISRLAVAHQIERREIKTVLSLLFKGLYQFSLQRNYRNLLVVVEPHWLPLFARRFGFTFTALGPVLSFPDRTLAVAASANIKNLEAELSHGDPASLEWYRSLEEAEFKL